MAGPGFRLPGIHYPTQQEAIQEFLQNFKSSNTEEAARDALSNLHVNDNDEMQLDETPRTRGGRRSGRRANAASRRREQQKPKYMAMLQEIANRERDAITIDLEDLKEYEDNFAGEPIDLASFIEKNTATYVELFSRAIDQIMPPATVDPSYNDDVLDVIITQRRNRNNLMEKDSDTTEAPDLFPASLTRRYQLYFKPRLINGTDRKPLAVRQIRAENLGHLITVRGITTRVSDVKPSVVVNAYTCERCGSEVFQEVKTKQYAPLVECPADECKRNDVKGQLFMSTRASKFFAFQEVRVQELPDQVPVGHIPRSLTIHVRGPLTRSIGPGDMVDIGGIFMPTPYTGFKALRAGLLTDTYLEAQYVYQHKKQYDQLQMDISTLHRIDGLRRHRNLYETLARSIAPEIHGHDDVKKCLLLLLIGGVTKEMGDGMRIRGDINVCLMGDPGVAKSQLLKYITKVAPRGIYTSGRGSSGVGLTAAVMRDPVTDEMVLEGGALVLADNGICCIDEFDKMDDADRTAIHEVMEQQTISISKAGITTTLNARTSILAAANPLYGRYNPKISPAENINLPAALLSRFDILFLILDTPSRDNDERLAEHVTYVHMENKAPEMDFEPLSPMEMRMYIAQARQKRPVVPKSVGDYLVGAYVRLRKIAKRDEGGKKQFTHVSPRTLLGILRLSQALARLRFSEEVVIEDVDEALRLVEVSKASLYDEAPTLGADTTTSSRIYHIIRAAANRKSEVSMRIVRERVLAKGFTEDALMACIEEYEGLDVWQIGENGTRLVFIGDEEDEDVEMS